MADRPHCPAPPRSGIRAEIPSLKIHNLRPEICSTAMVTLIMNSGKTRQKKYSATLLIQDQSTPPKQQYNVIHSIIASRTTNARQALANAARRPFSIQQQSTQNQHQAKRTCLMPIRARTPTDPALPGTDQSVV